MTEKENAGTLTPSGHPTDVESIDLESRDTITTSEANALLRDFRGDLGENQADALEVCREKHGVGSTEEMYEFLDAPVEERTLEITLPTIEIWLLVDALDWVTSQEQSAWDFVSHASLFNRLLEATPDEVERHWLAERADVELVDDSAPEDDTDE